MMYHRLKILPNAEPLVIEKLQPYPLVGDAEQKIVCKKKPVPREDTKKFYGESLGSHTEVVWWIGNIIIQK